MRMGRCWAILLLMLLLPTVVLAAPERISLAVYEERLQQVVRHVQAARWAAAVDRDRTIREIEQARALLAPDWIVTTPTGHAPISLRSLVDQLAQAAATPESERLVPAVALAEDYLRAAVQAGETTAIAPDGARERLTVALRKAEARQEGANLIDRALRWLFGERAETETATRLDNLGPYLSWGAALIGALGLSALSYGLFRSLTHHSGGDRISTREGRKARASQPVTPEGLRERARTLSSEGQQLEALRVAYQALMLHFDRLGLVRMVAAFTLREQERLLRRKEPALARRLHGLNDLLEVRLYAGHGATAADFAACDDLIDQLWREGDLACRRAEVTSGASSSARSL